MLPWVAGLPVVPKKRGNARGGKQLSCMSSEWVVTTLGYAVAGVAFAQMVECLSIALRMISSLMLL
jgi:hypothetical protein